MYDYRRVLAENLTALLYERGLVPKTLKAVYLSGPRKGKQVSERMIRYMMEVPESDTPLQEYPPSPALDVLAAIAQSLRVPVHLLLLPGLDPKRPPVIWSTEQVREAQEIARAYARLLGSQSGEVGESAGGGTTQEGSRGDGAASGHPPNREAPSALEGRTGARKTAKRH